MALTRKANYAPLLIAYIRPPADQPRPKLSQKALSRAVPVILRSAPWNEPETGAFSTNRTSDRSLLAPSVYALFRSLPRLSPISALPLLNTAVPDELVRNYALYCVSTAKDEAFVDLLPPLVQLLKHERGHFNSLAHLLLIRGNKNETEVKTGLNALLLRRFGSSSTGWSSNVLGFGR